MEEKKKKNKLEFVVCYLIFNLFDNWMWRIRGKKKNVYGIIEWLMF